MATKEILRDDQTVIVYGRNSKELASSIGKYLNLPVLPLGIKEHPDMEVYVPAINENIRGKDVVYIGSTPSFYDVKPTDVVMDYVLAGDTSIRSSARSFNFFIPYMPFLRMDRTKGARTSLTSKRAIDMLMMTDPNAVMLIDPHEERIEGFFPANKPPDFLWATNLVAARVSSALKEFRLAARRVLGLAPDHGAKVRTTLLIALAREGYNLRANRKIAFADKDRINPEETVLLGINVGNEIKGAVVLLPDDIIAGGTTMMNPAIAAKKMGASIVLACATHAVLVNDNNGRPKILSHLDKPDSPIDGLIITNTLKIPDSVRNHPRVWVLDIAQYAALAIHHAWGISYPGIKNGGGSLRTFNHAAIEMLDPQPMPPALRGILAAKLKL